MKTQWAKQWWELRRKIKQDTETESHEDRSEIPERRIEWSFPGECWDTTIFPYLAPRFLAAGWLDLRKIRRCSLTKWLSQIMLEWSPTTQLPKEFSGAPDLNMKTIKTARYLRKDTTVQVRRQSQQVTTT
jgi:hypothetical protein